MIRNECCTERELISICLADEYGIVNNFYKCPLCGRTYRENTIDLYISKNKDKKTVLQNFSKKHPDALVLRETLFFKLLKNKKGQDVKTPVYNLGYIN